MSQAYFVLYVVIAAILLPGMKRTGRVPLDVCIEKDMATLNRTRFVWAMLIVFTHCSLRFSPLPAWLIPFRKVSTFGVGYFFMMSGYGLAYSVDRKPGYLKRFWEKIAYLAGVAITASLLTKLIEMLVLHTKFSLRFNINWFMYALIACYALFYVAYRFFGESRCKRLVCLTLLLLIGMEWMRYLDLHSASEYRDYYISEGAFVFGAFVYEYRETVGRYMAKRWMLPALVISLAGTFVLALSVPEKTIWDGLFHNIMLFPTFLLLLYVCAYVEVDNRVLRGMSRCALEIFLYHFVVMRIVGGWYQQMNRAFDMPYFLIVLTAACLLAVPLYALRTQLLRWLQRHAKRRIHQQ